MTEKTFGVYIVDDNGASIRIGKAVVDIHDWGSEGKEVILKELSIHEKEGNILIKK